MKLEDQVTNLELSKKLKELGVKQESLFFWTLNEYNHWVIYGWRDIENYKQTISAFTVAELGEMLPSSIKVSDYFNWYFKSSKMGSGWEVHYENRSGKFFADTEANARAKMLIYLIENKLV